MGSSNDRKENNCFWVFGCYLELILFDLSTSNHPTSEAEQPSIQSIYKGIKTFFAKLIVIADMQSLYHHSLTLSSVRRRRRLLTSSIAKLLTRFSAPSQSRSSELGLDNRFLPDQQFELDTLAGLPIDSQLLTSDQEASWTPQQFLG